MLLDIIITHYKESEEVLKPLLDSIALQRGIDFKKDIKVTIVNDGNDLLLRESLFKKYPFKVQYLIMDHGGLSAARQYGFDHSDAEYVMFCDADDVFCNNLGLWYVLKHEIEEHGAFDTVTTPFYEELKVKDKIHYIMRGDILNSEIDATFVHGKIHRRQFIVDNNIHWKKQLTLNEDSYYNTLCRRLAKDTRYINFPFYCWCWRDDSTVRIDLDYGITAYTNLIDSNEELVKEFLIRGKVDFAKETVCNTIYSAYYELLRERWANDKYNIYKARIAIRLKEYLEKFDFLYNDTAEDIKQKIKDSSKHKVFKDKSVPTTITFEQWFGGIYDKTYN